MKKYQLILVIIVVLLVIFSSLYLILDRSEEVTDDRNIQLYFSTPDAMYLQPEERSITTDQPYRDTLILLIEGPETAGLNKTIPKGVKLLEIKVDEGTAEVNFSKELAANHWGGSAGERLTIYSIVNTLTQFQEIERVQILLDGENVETLVGHMDLSRPLERNREIIKNP
ncbi:MAG: GerMN domain-containing protein [Halanaerobiales bacterium]